MTSAHEHGEIVLKTLEEGVRITSAEQSLPEAERADIIRSRAKKTKVAIDALYAVIAEVERLVAERDHHQGLWRASIAADKSMADYRETHDALAARVRELEEAMREARDIVAIELAPRTTHPSPQDVVDILDRALLASDGVDTDGD